MDVVFAPAGTAWQRVSPRLRTVRRIACAAPLLLLALVLLGLALLGLPSWAVLLGAVLLVGVAAYVWWWTGRETARWGYAELAEELAITRGALVRRLVVVPYGRMQYVDVRSGPLDRLFGIATVQLHTASPGTTAVIPGLPGPEAARLRDRLTALGESEAAGL